MAVPLSVNARFRSGTFPKNVTTVVCIDHLFSEFLTSDALSPHYIIPQTKEKQLQRVNV